MKKILFSLLCGSIGLAGMAMASVEVSTTSLDKMIDLADAELTNTNITTVDEEELLEAITLLHKHDITKYDTVTTFMPDQNIRRDEAAKMYVNFEKGVLGEEETPIGALGCSFTDLHLGHSDLPDLMVDSCERGLFKGHLGAFMPVDPITNAQAVIVLIRMIDGLKDEPSDTHYATNYMSAAEDMDLLDNLGISSQAMWDSPASRATVAQLLFRASEVDSK